MDQIKSKHREHLFCRLLASEAFSSCRLDVLQLVLIIFVLIFAFVILIIIICIIIV